MGQTFLRVVVDGATTLDGLSDVTASSPSSGDFLKWDGSAWVNDPINLATDTVGNYVASLVAGTGITLSNNSGEGATPTVAIDSSTVVTLTGTQTLTNKTINNPTITGTISLPQYINFQGSVNDAYYTTLTVTEPTSYNQITLPNRSGIVITDGDTATVTNAMLAGSIANNKLSNSSITINGTSISLGGSATITAAASTLTGTTLNSTVVNSSLTSVGTLSSLTVSGDVSATQYYGRARDTEIRFFMEVI